MFRLSFRFLQIFVATLLVAGSSVAQSQEHAHPQKPLKPAPSGQEQAQQKMAEMPAIKPEFPRLGKSQENPATPLLRLEELEQMALSANPTLAQADAELRTSRARQLQSGLYPNPRVGYVGEEIRGGSLGGGQHGFFVSQTLVTAGKLGLNRQISGQDVRISEIEAEEQRMRVTNAVRIGYYRLLAAQETLDAKRDLLRIAADNIRTLNELRNIGQYDESEVLEAEIELQRHEMAVVIQENVLRQEWRSLTAFVGRPDLHLRTVAGNLEQEAPELDEKQIIQALVEQSPAVRIAQASVEKAKALLTREKREPIPDIEVRGGLQRNGEILGPGRRVGLQGFAEVGVQLPIFNRNQGSVDAARMQLDRSQQEVNRVQLLLRERAAIFLDMYHTARITAERYRSQLLPRAGRAYEALVRKHGLMLASYPQVLLAKQRLFQLHAEYIGALEEMWIHATTLRGLLLTDGLEAPARPGEIDIPIREINVPKPPRMAQKEE